MRLILDNGAYSLRNMGDVAMLQVSVKRLRHLLRNPELMILTCSPELLRRYFPDAVPLNIPSRDAGYESNLPARSTWGEAWARLKVRWRRAPVEAREFQKALDGAEGVFLCGGGFLNDLNPYQTRPVLRMLTAASLCGKRTAMFSQGLGPLASPELIALLRRACGAGGLIALRESVYGPEILRRAQCAPEQYFITGDDAVEMAWERGVAPDGNALGFSLRQVAYSEIEHKHLSTLAGVLQTLKKKLGTNICSLPISFNSHERDHEVIAEILRSQPVSGLDAPEALIDATACCRVLLTGTYHAAVFALSRGIPCVCFYASTYYRNKLEGLSKQFPGGCEVIDLASNDSAASLVNATLRLWDSAGKLLAGSLTQHAEAQVQAARRFYSLVVTGI